MFYYRRNGKWDPKRSDKREVKTNRTITRVKIYILRNGGKKFNLTSKIGLGIKIILLINLCSRIIVIESVSNWTSCC